ncbi:MAG: glutamate--cysteine ligase [Burkholderiaceae bacterium]|nr:glutamate--cysteine ligase [Burkholderiaceae bacterium]
MALPPFKPSQPLTLGVELELQLLHPGTRDLHPVSAELLALLERRGFPGQAMPEITLSMIEIASGVHPRHGTLKAQLEQMRLALVAGADTVGAQVAGGGTHAFQQWTERTISDKPRFQQVSALYGYLAKQFTVFGQHIHVGCSSGDEALYLLHALNRYVPHFIALSASSPFVQGQDTAFDSARLNSVFAFPLSGRAPFVLNWRQFCDGYFQRMEATGIVQGMKDFYWDIRPKPEYGTIELRVCDTPLTSDQAADLAGYLQVLCAWLLEGGRPAPHEDDYLVYTYNRFQACRFGLDGMLVEPRQLQPLRLRDDIAATLEQLAPLSRQLGAEAALAGMARLLEQGNDAQWLRERSAPGLPAMVDAAAACWRDGRRGT